MQPSHLVDLRLFDWPLLLGSVRLPRRHSRFSFSLAFAYRQVDERPLDLRMVEKQNGIQVPNSSGSRSHHCVFRLLDFDLDARLSGALNMDNMKRKHAAWSSSRVNAALSSSGPAVGPRLPNHRRRRGRGCCLPRGPLALQPAPGQTTAATTAHSDRAGGGGGGVQVPEEFVLASPRRRPGGFCWFSRSLVQFRHARL